MNELQLHKMIRTQDTVRPTTRMILENKSDYPFFNRLAHQDTDMKDMVEASERFYKHRNTQLPTLYRMGLRRCP